MSEKGQVKSRQRVQDHGEVFTAPREVNAMLDLVKQETERIDSRFLEPACGDGNFLEEILRRKLQVVKRRYRRKASDFERYSLLALSSIYGVELLSDNASSCRARLFKLWDKHYTDVCKKSRLARDCRETARYLLERNILCGDALSLLDEDGHPLIFSQWSLIGRQFKRADYTLDGLLNAKPRHPDQVPLSSSATNGRLSTATPPAPSQLDFLDMLEQNPASDLRDSEITNCSPPPPALPPTDDEGRLLLEYPLTDYWRIAHEFKRDQSPGLQS